MIVNERQSLLPKPPLASLLIEEAESARRKPLLRISTGIRVIESVGKCVQYRIHAAGQAMSRGELIA